MPTIRMTGEEVRKLLPSSNARKQTPESIVTEQVRDFLSAHGWRPVRMQRTAIPGAFSTGEPGMADYLFINYLGGSNEPFAVTLWIEFKRPGGRLHERQERWIAKERVRGGKVFVISSFDEFLQEYEARFAWLHDGRVKGQIDMFMGGGAQ